MTKGKGARSRVDSGEFADVLAKLVEGGFTVDGTQRRLRLNEVLDGVQRFDREKECIENGMDLPDLDAATNTEIVSANVRLAGPIIVAAMFEELKAFTVVDKLVEQFQAGQLPIGSAATGKILYEYWKKSPDRMSESERRNLYAMTLGRPGGDTPGRSNRDFDDLWNRFVSAVSSYGRQSEVDRLDQADASVAVGHQQIRKAARDLTAHLSGDGSGVSHHAVLELQQQIKSMVRVLGDREIWSAFGARDMWQVIDEVATRELGGSRSSSRYRTLATCGAVIAAWLGNNVSRIMQPRGPIIDIRETLNSAPPPSRDKPSNDPSDDDLVKACELWLADTSTSDERVEELAQPREAPVEPSKSVPIPSVAKDILDDLGLPPPE